MSKQEIVNELHKSARRNYQRRKVITKGLDDLWQCDLVIMIPYARENKGNKYLLTVIDVFSKFAWAEPVKSKSAADVTNAMSRILKQNRTPKNLQTDNGKEFYNSEFTNLMKKYKINHYSTYSNLKASVVERFNRTLKNCMWREFSLQGTYKWDKILQKLVSKYNNTKHRTIGLKPINVTKSNEKFLLNTVYSKIKIFGRGKFKEGDYVRISKYKGTFDKGFTPNWSTEIFRIIGKQITNPITYKLEDLSGDLIKGGFYEEELQKTQFPNTYLVEKILKRKGSQVYVKWLGFNSSHNSWINKKDIVI